MKIRTASVSDLGSGNNWKVEILGEHEDWKTTNSVSTLRSQLGEGSGNYDT